MKDNEEKLFSLETKRHAIKRSDLLKDLIAFKNYIGKDKASAAGYKKWKDARYSKDSITRQFGSWEKACKEAGMLPQKIKKYSEEELIKHLEKVWRWRGQRVTQQDLKDYNSEFDTTINHDSYLRRWGDWKTVLTLFSQYKLKQISLEKFISLSGNHKNKRVAISPKLRAEILARDNYTCVDCGANKTNDKKIRLEVHHVIPVSKGGRNDPSNLVANCSACNRGKSNKIAGKTIGKRNIVNFEDSISKIIRQGESECCEWKATARFSLKLQQHDKELYYPVIKSICALANTKGGIVVVGYDETTKKYVGINKDGFNQDSDKWENWIRQKLDHHTRREATWINGVRFAYEVINDALCAKIEVIQQSEPVVCSGIGKNASKKYTFVRAGAYNRSLDDPRDIIDYFSKR